MGPICYPIIRRSIKKLINDALKQRELVESRKKIDDLCKKMGYRHVKTCSDCHEITPKELSLVSKKEKDFEEVFSSFPKKRRNKDIKKLFKRAFFGGVTCSYYAKGGWFREKREGLIFSQEYCIKLAESIPPEQLANKPLRPLLGIIECHGYGNWDGKEEEILYKNCRDKLGIPKDVVIKRIDPSKIIKNDF